MKKIKMKKEGMWVVAPCVAGVLMFGTLIYVAWEQDVANKNQAVELEKTKDELAQYKKLIAKRDHTIKELTTIIDGLNTDKKGLEFAIQKLKQDRTIYLEGKVYFATQSFTANATAYTQSDEEQTADGTTATGTHVKEGRTIAVDTSVIPLGSIVYIESASPYVGGFYIAEDTGGAIKGNKIDIFMDSKTKAFKFGKQQIKVTVLEGASLD